MASERTILRLGKSDEGRDVTSQDFGDAEFDQPWRDERERGRLVITAKSGEGLQKAANPWRDQFILFSHANPGVIPMVATEAWIRVNDGTDRIADLAVDLTTGENVPRIPDRVPDLILEVVSSDPKSSQRDDLMEKVEYHRLGVKEYVIVDRFRKQLIVFTDAPNRYLERILNMGDVSTAHLLAGFSVRLSAVL